MSFWIIWMSESGHMESVVHVFLSPNLEAFLDSPVCKKDEVLCLHKILSNSQYIQALVLFI